MEDDGDLEFACDPVEEVAVQDVADPARRAAARQRRIERLKVERQDVECAQVGETLDQAVSHFAVGAGYEDCRLARHRVRRRNASIAESSAMPEAGRARSAG